MKAERERGETQIVWDPMVRITHWSLVAFFFLAYWMGGDRLNLHAQAGYTIALLVAFRVFWGFTGPRPARFCDFVVQPARLVDYLGRLWQGLGRGQVPVHTGHDPAGAVMIVTLLVVLAVTAGSGMVLFAMEHRGPVPAAWVADLPGALVESVHHSVADLSLILVVAHILGVLVMSVLTRRNLTAAMIHGRQAGGASGDP